MLRALTLIAAIGLLGHATEGFANGDRVDPEGLLDRITHSDQFESVRTAFLEGRGEDAAAELEAFLGKGEVSRAALAVERLLIATGGVAAVLGWLMVLIPLPLRDWGYRQIANRRLAISKSVSCGIPEEGLVEKMLD